MKILTIGLKILVECINDINRSLRDVIRGGAEESAEEEFSSLSRNEKVTG